MSFWRLGKELERQLGGALAAAQQSISGPASQFCDCATITKDASRHLGGAVGDVVDRAAPADIVEMHVQESPRRALAELVQALEEIEVVVETAVGVEGFARIGHHDAMQPDAAAVAAAGAPRQPSLIDQFVDQINRD